MIEDGKARCLIMINGVNGGDEMSFGLVCIYDYDHDTAHSFSLATIKNKIGTGIVHAAYIIHMSYYVSCH